MPTLIRHLKGDTHAYSRHLIDHSLCNKINIYRCTHSDCSTNNNTFFQSLRTYEEHNKNFHPLTCIPTQSQTTQNNMALFDSLFEGPGSTNLTNNWNHGCMYISNNYHQDPPHFRSTWRRFISGNNKKRFNYLLSSIIANITKTNDPHDSATFWWLLFNFERLILAPTPIQDRTLTSIKHTLTQRLLDFRCGNIQALMEQTTFNNNTPRHCLPTDQLAGNKAAQIAADNDNYRTAITRTTTFNKIATITHTNLNTVHKLYPPPCTRDTQDRSTTTHNNTNTHTLHLPGDVCMSIRSSGKNKGTGLQTDSIDSFISLVKLNDKTINQNIQQLFNLIYQGDIPTKARHFFTDT